jgi:hypothetical protein
VHRAHGTCQVELRELEERKLVAADLKAIYRAATERQAVKELDSIQKLNKGDLAAASLPSLQAHFLMRICLSETISPSEQTAALPS